MSEHAMAAADVDASALSQILDAVQREGKQVDTLRITLGRFLYDSGKASEGSAVRSSFPASASRQLAYATAGGDISVSVMRSPSHETVDVHGQFLNHDDTPPTPFDVRLLRHTNVVENVFTDEFGEFHFEAVDPGDYRLILASEAMNVLIPDIELRA